MNSLIRYGPHASAWFQPETSHNMGVFNRSAAVAYAYKFAINANPDFPNLDWIRGDCTNFISQCMLAGGWPMVWGPKGNGLCWFSHSKEERSSGVWDKYIRPYF